MKLTPREIELLPKIPAERAKRRRNRFIGCAGWLAVPVLALWADFDLRYILRDIYSMVGGVLGGLS